jgi:hypothetical protein
MQPRLRLTVLVSVSSLICGGGLPAMQRSQGRGAAPEMAITGRVVDPSGKPACDPKRPARADANSPRVEVQPGTYFLQFRESQWPPRGTIPKVSQAKVVISGADVPNMRVAPLTMVRATGRLVVDPAERALLDPSSVRVGPLPTPFDGNPGPSRYGTVGSDLTFEFGAWPIPARIRVMIESPGWLIKAVRHNGVDITDKTIDFVQGKEITGLEVVLTRGPTRR